MPGTLDMISLAIGAQGEAVKGLKESFDRHCDDDDRRHDENLRALHANTETLARLERSLEALQRALDPIASRVAAIGPIVDGYQLTRTKFAAWASVGVGLLIALSWIAEAGVKWMVAMLLSHLK